MPVTDAERRAYSAELARLRKQMNKLEAGTVKQTVRLTRSLNKDLRAIIAGADQWDQGVLSDLKNAMDARVRTFQANLDGSAADGLNQGWELGTEMIDSPLTKANITFALPDISEQQLVLMQGFKTELITGLGDDTVKSVRSALNMSMLGAETPFEAAKRIDKILGVKAEKGITYRAERIVRTEVKRAQSVATQARLEQAQEQVPGLRKVWLWSGKIHGRENHAAIDGQIRKVDEPFNLGPHLPMYPRDPILPPEESINCGCDEAPHIEEV